MDWSLISSKIRSTIEEKQALSVLGGRPRGRGTVLPNGVKVAVWDFSQIFQKWKKEKFYHVVCIHIEWIWSKNEQVTAQSF